MRLGETTISKRIPIASLIGFGCVALAIATYGWHLHVSRPVTKTPAKMAPAASTTPKAAVTAKPDLNPLTIEAMRQRSYPGSAITVTQDLGEKNGYHNSTVSFTADGLTEFALTSTPDGAPPSAGWPVIILNHGFINPAQYSESLTWYVPITTALTHAGYMVIVPDYRGNGGSQGQPEGGEYSPGYAYDVLNLISSLKRHPQINPSRIGLLGHSMGGSIELRVMVVSGDVRAAAFMNGVVGSLYDMYYNWTGNTNPADQPIALARQVEQQLLDTYGTPKANPDFWGSASPINYVNAVTAAVQVNQDTGDSTVPRAFSDHLVSALHQAQKPVSYYTYPGDDHMFSQPANLNALIGHLVSFYQANL